jgi:hypothetical protein
MKANDHTNKEIDDHANDKYNALVYHKLSYSLALCGLGSGFGAVKVRLNVGGLTMITFAVGGRWHMDAVVMRDNQRIENYTGALLGIRPRE